MMNPHTELLEGVSYKIWSEFKASDMESFSFTLDQDGSATISVDRHMVHIPGPPGPMGPMGGTYDPGE